MITNMAYYRAIKLISGDKILAFTDHPTDIKIDNTTYSSIDTIRIDNIELNSTLNSTTESFILHLNDKTQAILAGQTQLTVEIFCVKIINQEIRLIKLKTGKISEIKVEKNKLIVEIQSIISLLNNNLNGKYTTNCKACFGDHKCKINREDYVINNIKVLNTTVDCIEIDMKAAIFPSKLNNIEQDHLKKLIENGYILGIDGTKLAKVINFNNTQLKIEFVNFHTGLLPGDFINLQCMCDKSFRQCNNIFNNKMQFRGEILSHK